MKSLNRVATMNTVIMRLRPENMVPFVAQVLWGRLAHSELVKVAGSIPKSCTEKLRLKKCA